MQVGEFIREQGGVVTAEQLAPYLDPPPAPASSSEQVCMDPNSSWKEIAMQLTSFNQPVDCPSAFLLSACTQSRFFTQHTGCNVIE